MKWSIQNKHLLLSLLSCCILSSFINKPVFAVDNNTNKINLNNNVKTQAENNFLTLYQAIDISVKNSYALQTASEKIKLAEFVVTENAAQGLPQLNITTTYGRQDPVDASSSSALGSLGSSPQFAALLGTARVNSFSNKISLTQVLFAGFRVVDGIKLAGINVKLNEESYRQSRQDVIRDVSNAYYNALKCLKFVDVNKETLRQCELHLDQAKKFYNSGTSIKLDVTLAENQLINAQMELSKSLNLLEKSKMALNLYMGRSIDTPIVLNSAAEVTQINYNEQKAVEDGLLNRSEIRQLQYKKDMDEIAITIQGRSSWPTIAASTSYNISDTSVVNSNSNNTQNLSYGVNMNWPLFDGLATHAKVQKAENTLVQDQISIDQLRQSIVLDVKQSLLDIQEAKERIILAKKGIEVANESLRIAETRYNNGVGTSTDVRDAQTTVNKADLNLVTAEFDLNVSRVKLYRAVGLDI